MTLEVVPVDWRTARAFVESWHRHLPAPRGYKYAIGAGVDGVLVAVVIVGRPVARRLDDGATLEVTRLASDGTPNACSLLYGAAWRVARALGYSRLVTYTRADEVGSSLRAAGYTVVGSRRVRAEGWSRPSRPRDDREQIPRTLWEVAS